MTRPHSDVLSDFPEILGSRNQGLISTRHAFAVVALLFSSVYDITKSPTGWCTFYEIIG